MAYPSTHRRAVAIPLAVAQPLTAHARQGSARPAPGFTLVELVVVMAVTAILAVLSAPGFQLFREGAAIGSARAQLRTALELARSEAITRAERVGVCRSLNANDALPVCNSAAGSGFAVGDWASGWIVYAKARANTLEVFESGDTVVTRQMPLGPSNARGRVSIWAPGSAAVLYNWNGLRASGLSGSFLLDYGSTLARPTPAASRRATCLNLNAAGRLNITAPVSGACA